MDGLRHLAFRGNDVIVFQLLDPAELRFDFQDAPNLWTWRRGRKCMSSRISSARNIAESSAIRSSDTRRSARKDRMDFSLIDTSQPLDSALFSYLRPAGTTLLNDE